MRVRSSLSVMVIALTSLVAAAAPGAADRNPPGSGWATQYGDTQHSFAGVAVAPTNPGVRWYSQLPANYVTSDGDICGTAVGCHAVIDGDGRLVIKARDTAFDDGTPKYDLLLLDPVDGSVELVLDDMGASACVAGVGPDGNLWTFQSINERTEGLAPTHSRASAWIVKVDPATGSVEGRYDGKDVHPDPDEAGVSHCGGNITFGHDGTVLFIDTPPTVAEGGFDPWLRAIDPTNVTPRWEHRFARAVDVQSTYDNAVRRVLPQVLVSPPDPNDPGDAGAAYAFYNFDPRQSGAENDRRSEIWKFDIASGALQEVFRISTGDFFTTPPIIDPDGGIITVTGQFAEAGTGRPWVTRIVDGADGLQIDWQVALEEERVDDSRLRIRPGDQLSINGDLVVGYYAQGAQVVAFEWRTGDVVWEYKGRQFQDTHDVPVDAVGTMFTSQFGGAAAVEVFDVDGRRQNWLTGEELMAQTDGNANTQLRSLGPIAADGTLYGWASTGDGGVWIAFEQQADVVRASGDGRIGTSVAVSQQAILNPDEKPVGAVLLAYAYNYPDALAGGPLARALDGVVLLSDRDQLASDVKAEIRRLSPDTVYLLGGSGALGAGVEADLASLGYSGDAVVRLAGTSRFDTARLIANELARVRPHHLAPDGVAYVVQGQNADPLRGWPDAVSVSALAAMEGRPILPVTRDTLPDGTRQALIDLDISTVVVVGGEGAVSAEVAADLADYIRGGAPEADVVRISGTNRFATSQAVVAATLESPEYLRGQPFPSLTTPTGRTYVATGLSFPDALGAGLAAAYGSGILVLVHGLDADEARANATWLSDFDGAFGDVVIVGGPGAVTPAVEEVIRDLIGA